MTSYKFRQFKFLYNFYRNCSRSWKEEMLTGSNLSYTVGVIITSSWYWWNANHSLLAHCGDYCAEYHDQQHFYNYFPEVLLPSKPSKIALAYLSILWYICHLSFRTHTHFFWFKPLGRIQWLSLYIKMPIPLNGEIQWYEII